MAFDRLPAGGQHARDMEAEGVDPRTLPYHCVRCGEVEWDGCDAEPCQPRDRWRYRIGTVA